MMTVTWAAPVSGSSCTCCTVASLYSQLGGRGAVSVVPAGKCADRQVGHAACVHTVQVLQDSPELGSPKSHAEGEDLPACGPQHGLLQCCLKLVQPMPQEG